MSSETLISIGLIVGMCILIYVLISRAIDGAAMYCPHCGALSVRNDICSVCGWDLEKVTGYVSSEERSQR